ncbi:hypothetical protein QMU90_002160 [Edwardsiella ictaluri]|uniref:Mechanosensitive ion channel family protein n=1 Tax=Edwardsiella ictaluri TaxID=67780 RepID=A0ABY8GCR8_EDWIC|nr:hypothetical protein [Edwardsiella ictaluri]ELV7528308.1 hypothetical protein [Edwardsiella ictaluri]WFN95304.1 mechanosensitive ion channel family protein [Edwardsiella ictaluri]
MIPRVPNALLTSSNIVNPSTHTAHSGIIINTGVTISYDMPWRQVHAMLLLALPQTKRRQNGVAPVIRQNEYKTQVCQL